MTCVLPSPQSAESETKNVAMQDPKIEANDRERDNVIKEEPSTFSPARKSEKVRVEPQLLESFPLSLALITS